MLLPSPPCCAQHCGTPLLSGSAAPAPRPSLLGHARQTQGPNDTGHLSHRELGQAPGLAQEGVGKGLTQKEHGGEEEAGAESRHGQSVESKQTQGLL